MRDVTLMASALALSSKVKLPHAINFRALCGADLVTLRSKSRGFGRETEPVLVLEADEGRDVDGERVHEEEGHDPPRQHLQHLEKKVNIL